LQRSNAAFNLDVAEATLLPANSHDWAEISKSLDAIDDIYCRYDFDIERTKLKDKRQDLSDPSVLIFVIGEGNFGKSSLINALLGREVAEVSRQPKTWRIDLFRSVPAGKAEYAEIRRWHHAQRERLSISDAINACHLQEEMIRSVAAQGTGEHQTESDDTGMFPGQIIEVNWHYQDLQIDPRIVLVDTPGFAQFRAGMNQARSKVLASSDGIVFDINETYEFYYHRADLVLWAFRANKINDHDTIEALNTLSAHSKSIYGVLTNFDRIPAENRTETFQQAQKLYGKNVLDFTAVVAGGNSGELGLGIEELQARLRAFSEEASTLKLRSARNFCADAASFGHDWLESIGNAMVRNIAEVAQYCNATSDRLLRAANSCSRNVNKDFDRNHGISSKSSTFRQFLGNLIESNLPIEEKKLKVSAYLKIEQWREEVSERLHSLGQLLVVEGKTEARSHPLQQVVIKGTGKTEFRQLEARMLPPDVNNFSISIDRVVLPDVETFFIDEIFRIFDGTFIGKIANFLGGRSKEDRRDFAAEKAAKKIADAFQLQVNVALQSYVKAAASAILVSAESGLRNVYKNGDFISLEKEAASLDRDIASLARVRRSSSDDQAAVSTKTEAKDGSYETIVQLWSPVNNPRQAVIDLFVKWFEEHHFQLHAEAWGRLEPAIAETPIVSLGDNMAACCRAYLTETIQTRNIAKDVYMKEIRSQRTGCVNMETKVTYWAGMVADQMVKNDLFDDSVNFLLISFKHIHLKGLAGMFAKQLRTDFKEHFARLIENNPAVRAEETRFPEPLSIIRRMFNPVFMLGISALGAFCGYEENHDVLPYIPFYFHLHPLGFGIVIAMACGALSLTLQRQFWLRRKRSYTINRFTELVIKSIWDFAHRAWHDTLQTFDSNLARTIVSKHTLVKKQPLEYAKDGAFADYTKVNV